MHGARGREAAVVRGAAGAGACAALWMIAIGAVGCGVGPKGMLGQSAPIDAGGRLGEAGVSSPLDGGATGGVAGGASGGAAGGVSGRAGAGGGPSGRDAGTDSTNGAGGADGPPPLSDCARGPLGLVSPRAPVVVPATVVACGDRIRPGNTLKVAPAASGQQYVRCGTVGPETSWQVALSPDAGRLAALTSAGTVRLFETTGWHEIAQVAFPVGMIDAMAFSPDGATLATVSGEMGAVMLWNAADGSPLGRYVGIPVSTVGRPSSALAFSTDGQRLATSVGLIIDPMTGALTNFAGRSVAQSIPLPNPATNRAIQTSTGALQFVGCDGRVLVNGADQGATLGWVGRLSLTDPSTGASTPLVSGLNGGLPRFAVSPDRRWVAVMMDGPGQAGLSLVDAASGVVIASSSAAIDAVIGFSPGGTQLFTVDRAEIQVRIVPSLAVAGRVALPAGMWATAVTPDGIIVSDGVTSAWLDPFSGAVRRRATFPITSAPSFSADGRYGVTSGGGGALFHLWQESDATELCAPAPAGGAAVAGMALSPDGGTLALIGMDGAAELRAIDAGGAVGPAWSSIATALKSYGSHIELAVANGGARLAAQGIPPSPESAPQSVGSRLLVVDGPSGRTLLSRDLTRIGDRMALSGDGRWVAYVAGDFNVYGPAVTAVDSDATPFSLMGPEPPQIDSFSPDGHSLALAGDDGIEIWDLASGTPTTTYALPGYSIGNAGLSPDWSMAAGAVGRTRDPSAPSVSAPSATLFWRPGDGSVVQSLGVILDLAARPRFDPSASIAGLFSIIHTSGSDWYGWQVWSVSYGSDLRVFAASSDYREPLLPFANGQRLLTRAGSALAVWCR